MFTEHKAVDPEANLQATEITLASSIRRVSGKLVQRGSSPSLPRQKNLELPNWASYNYNMEIY